MKRKATIRKSRKVRADKRKPGSLHRLVRPFQRGNTSQWPERQRIRSALEDIHGAADEASRCLEMDERLPERLAQASQAIRELEVAVRKLRLSSGGKNE